MSFQIEVVYKLSVNSRELTLRVNVRREDDKKEIYAAVNNKLTVLYPYAKVNPVIVSYTRISYGLQAY